MTPLQVEVLNLSARGHSYSDIARIKGVSLYSIKGTSHGILKELGARNRAEAVMKGIREGYIKLR